MHKESLEGKWADSAAEMGADSCAIRRAAGEANEVPIVLARPGAESRVVHAERLAAVPTELHDLWLYPSRTSTRAECTVGSSFPAAAR